MEHDGMDSVVNRHEKEETNDRTSIRENGVTVKQSENKKSPGKLNPKLSVFREFALATAHAFAKDHAEKHSAKITEDQEDGGRQFFACDLVAQSGIAGIQWKRHIGDGIHVTAAEQRETLLLQDNIKFNGFTACSLPVDPKVAAGNLLPLQSPSEIHIAECDPTVLMLLEAFDFVYVDPHKNPAPFFSSLFRNVRNNGVLCVLVPDTMHFARSPHVVRRCYGANCIKTEYLKELAVRIILAALATEAAKCHKGLTMLYALSLEDFLLLCVRVVRGPKMADAMLPNIGYVLHCRICEERAVYPSIMAPAEDPYSMLGCDCQKNVPGKTGVILGPLWKGSMYEFSCLTKLAASGATLGLTPAFFALLQRAMEDCLCDSPPSLQSLRQGVHSAAAQSTASSSADLDKNSARVDGSQQKIDRVSAADSVEYVHNVNGSIPDSDCRSSSPSICDKMNSSGDAPSVDTSVTRLEGVKRSVSDKDEDAEAGRSPAKRLKSDCEPAPAPCFFYNVHSKRLGKDSLPKQTAIIHRLRAHGHRCCRTHFEKYAIRTSANLKTLTALLGSGESRVLYVKGSQENVQSGHGVGST